MQRNRALRADGAQTGFSLLAGLTALSLPRKSEASRWPRGAGAGAFADIRALAGRRSRSALRRPSRRVS
eukprot:5887960-Pyramimonas_sp.AAC.1